MTPTLILRTATLFLMPLLLLFSVFLLLRGHNAPGGGFAGGLTAAAAFALYGFAFGADAARTLLGVQERSLIAGGLGAALAAGAVGVMQGRPFLTSRFAWLEPDLPGFGPVAIGPPLLFDIGVWLVVIGSTLKIVLSLEE